MLVGAINAMIVVNTISNMTSVVMNGETIVTGGHDIAWASTVLSAELVLVVFCKVALGSMYDRLGLIPSTIIGAFTCFAANFFMIFNTTDWGPILGAVFFAFGTCIPLRILKTRPEFSEKSMGAFALPAKSSTNKEKAFSQVASCFASGLRMRRISGINCKRVGSMGGQFLAKPVFKVVCA